MLLRRVVVLSILFAAFAGAAQAAVDVTGVWKGSVSGSVTCGSTTVTETVSLTVTFQQSGQNITGSGTAITPDDPCVGPTPTDTVPITAVSATISGNSINGTVTFGTTSGGTQSAPFFATLTGNDTMTFTLITGLASSVTGTLTRQAAPSVDVNGSWSGTINVNEQCGMHSGTPTSSTWSSPVTLNLTQQNSTVFGAAILFAAADHDDRCHIIGTFQIVVPFTGSISGNTFSGSGSIPDALTFTGSVNGNSMTFTMGSSDFTSTANLTRSTTGALDSHLSGPYSGGYTATFIPCAGGPHALAPVTYSGTINGALNQVGSAVFGSITATNGKHDNDTGTTCQVTSSDDTLAITGVLNGNVLNGAFFRSGSDQQQSFTANVNGNTISGTVPGEFPGESLSFVVTKGSSTAVPPRILSFAATPPTIRQSQATTLTWSTDAAASVTIDNGVGAQGTSGSTTVTPNATTTYTLTATAGTQSVQSSVTVTVLTAPTVNVTVFPSTMLEVAGGSGTSTTFSVTNSGSASTTITVAPDKTFFAVSPGSFALAPGATQAVTITASSQPAGEYEGTISISGNGTPSGLSVPAKLVSVAAPTGSVTADPTSTRVDVTTGSGSVSFKNNGTARLVGALNSDVPWIIPQTGQVTIDPGQTGTFNFTIDRTRRPDSASLVGSQEGNLTISFLTGVNPFPKVGPFDNTTPPTPSVSIVKIVDTVQPPVTTGGIPGLASGEVALFVAGVGHVTGTKGALFVSDVSVLNPQGGKSVDDLKMYYTSLTANSQSAKATSLPSVPGQVSVAVGDVVKSVFASNEERGSLQIRSKDADKLAVAATVLTTNNPAGTFGNAIPVFRSDRAVAANDTIVLTGLKKDNTTHTNLYIQEAAGALASVQTDFLSSDGTVLGTRTDSIDAFKVLALDNIVPTNAVAAVLTNKSTAGGKIVAYATPVDESSGDTWAVADWSRTLGYSSSTDQVIIPVAGSVHGANSTFYRTDVAVTNRGTDPASGTLAYVSRTGATAQQQITLNKQETKVLTDIVGTLGVTGDTVGYLTFTPLTGSIAVSSRTFTTSGGSSATFGSGVPAIATSSALVAGGTRPIAGLADATRNTVVSAKPATYRTNFALMEITGRAVTVRVTFRFTFPAGAKAQGIGAASRDYNLNPNQFLMLNSIAGEILGPARLQYGDLTNVEADFQVVSGTGAVMLFTSSVDNATGDTILRTE